MNECLQYIYEQIPFPFLAASAHLFLLCAASITESNGGPILSNVYCSGWIEHLLTILDHASAWHQKPGQQKMKKAADQACMLTISQQMHRQMRTYGPVVYSFITYSKFEMDTR